MPTATLETIIGASCIIVLLVVLGTAVGWWDPLHLVDSGKDDDDE